MWVVIGPSFGIDYTQDVLLTAYYPNSASALPYQKFTTTITATNANPILSFHAVDANSAILLDNVSITYVAPPPPQLNFGLASTDKVVMSWTSPTNAFLLQTNTSLLTTNWVTLTNQPAVLGVTNQITLPRPATNVFYRLLLP
jgi:hypothetical protein